MKSKLLVLLGAVCYTLTALASLALGIEGGSLLRLLLAAAFGFLAVKQYRLYAKVARA